MFEKQMPPSKCQLLAFAFVLKIRVVDFFSCTKSKKSRESSKLEPLMETDVPLFIRMRAKGT